jgi:hypothetical protein
VSGPQPVGSPVSAESSGSGTSRTVDIQIPQCDAIVVVITPRKSSIRDATFNYGGANSGVHDAMEELIIDVVAGALVGVQVFATPPTSSTLTLTFESSENSDLDIVIYPFNGVGALPSNTDIDATGSTSLSLSLSTLTANNAAMLIAASFAFDGDIGESFETTIDDSRLRYFDSRLHTWNTSSKVSITVFLYQAAAAVTLTPTVTDLADDSFSFNAYLFELPAS